MTESKPSIHVIERGKNNRDSSTTSRRSQHTSSRPFQQEAIKSIARDLGHDSIGAEVVSLWLEYEDQSTPEARVVKDFDK